MRGLEAAPLMSDLPIQLGYVFLCSPRLLPTPKSPSRGRLTFPPALSRRSSAWPRRIRRSAREEAAVDYFRRCLMVNPAPMMRPPGSISDFATWSSANAMPATSVSAARRAAMRSATASRLSSLAPSSRGRFWLKPSDGGAISSWTARLTLGRAKLPAINVGLARDCVARFDHFACCLRLTALEAGGPAFALYRAGIAPPACPSAARR